MIVFCDIDGVLANCEHRLKYLRERDYDKFYGASMADDELINAGYNLIYGLKLLHTGVKVFFVTGRPERTRSVTKLWMEVNAKSLMPHDGLIMRKDGDHRPSPIVKTEQIRNIFHPESSLLDRALGEIMGVLDTRTSKEESPENVYFIDDDPENVKAVCEVFPEITGITFGIKRMEH